MQSYGNDWHSREAVCEGLRSLSVRGLNRGTSGNVSVRTAEGMLVTPTGLDPESLAADHIVSMGLDGRVDADQLVPSSEWRIHADIYSARPEAQAVVHCHSPYATILACARRPIPPMHYMVAAAGGDGIPLAGYATFGSGELSSAVLAALRGVSACLLANHGQVAVAASLPAALKLASLVEEMAQCYWGTLAIGGPVLLGETAMDEVLEAFASYGQQRPHTPRE
ncbi:class II aldolase/adducin family protein [Haliea sp. E17]|uniref:class II aldolase/adducin family protein n=1 Tax=Haliea sp. E17 TaxID=3401576 RepID=UPI003AAFB7C1